MCVCVCVCVSVYIAVMFRVFTNGLGDQSSIPG